MKILVYTDLDGTLLNHDYSYREALPAIGLLKKNNIPLMLVSSKTCDEMLVLRKELGNIHPFVCENGALIGVPSGVFGEFDMSGQSCEIVAGDRCYRYGESRREILDILQVFKSEYVFFGFSDLDTAAIARHTGLDPVIAEMANKRFASEPIVWRDTKERFAEFESELSERNLQVVEGGRFHHVMGQCNKGLAVCLLSELYRRYYGEPVYTIALGDSPNDLGMLENVNLSIVVPRMDGSHLNESGLNKPVLAPFPGARGWNDAINQVVGELLHKNM